MQSHNIYTLQVNENVKILINTIAIKYNTRIITIGEKIVTWFLVFYFIRKQNREVKTSYLEL